jgi:hypothetical protein
MVGDAAVAAANDQDLDELVEDDAVGDAGAVAAERVVDLAGWQEHGELVPEGSWMQGGIAGTRLPRDHLVSELGDHHGSCLPCSTPPTGAGP